MKFWSDLLSCRNIARIFVVLSMSFAFFQVYPTLGGDPIASGDKILHLAKEVYIAEVISNDNLNFRVFPQFLGLPLLRIYPPLFDLGVVLLHFLSFKIISVVFSHNIISALVFIFYPLGIYFMLRTFSFPYLVCGLGALLSLAPISSWGVSFTSYYQTGLMTQALNNFLLPLVIICIMKFISYKKISFIFLLLPALFILSHGSGLLAIIILCVIFLSAYLKKRDWAFNLHLFRRIFIMFAILFLLCAFWIAGMYEFSQNGTFYKAYPNLIATPVFKGFNTINFIRYFFNGQLFDNVPENSLLVSRPDEPQGFRFPVNIQYSRFGLFTIAIIIGLLTALVKGRKPRYGFFLIGFLCSILFVLGEDDVEILRYLSFGINLQPLRFLSLLDFFAICLGAIGVFEILVILYKIIRRTEFLNGFNFKFFAVIFSFLFIFPIYKERFLTCRRQIFIMKDYEKKQLDALKTKLIKEAEPYSRFWFSGKNAHHKHYLFSATGPFLVNSESLADILLSQRYIWQSIGFVPFSERLNKLLKIEYLITGKKDENSLRERGIGERFVSLSENDEYLIFKNKKYYNFLEPLQKNPILVIGDFDSWNTLNYYWFQDYRYERMNELFMIKVLPEQLKKISLFSLPLLILSPETINKNERDLLKEYQRNGGNIYSFQKIPWIETVVIGEYNFLRIGELLMFMVNGENQKTVNKIENLSEKFLDSSKYTAELDCINPGFFIFKTAYFRNWKAKVDGKIISTYPVSPCFVGLFLEKGKHHLEISWQNTILTHFSIMLSGISWMICLTLKFFKRRRHNRFIKSEYAFNFKQNRSFLSIFIAVFIIFYVFFLYLKQDFLLLPSIIKPRNTDIQNPAEVTFQWEKHPSKYILFDFELYKKNKGLKELVLQKRGVEGAELLINGLEKNTLYYWRFKPYWRGKAFRWSKFYRFKTGYLNLQF